MADRICFHCGREMRPVKNGFHFALPNGHVHASVLWGCKSCMRYQIHANLGKEMFKLYGFVDSGILQRDQGEMAESFYMIEEPVIRYTPQFAVHMREWFPDWKY